MSKCDVVLVEDCSLGRGLREGSVVDDGKSRVGSIFRAACSKVYLEPWRLSFSSAMLAVSGRWVNDDGRELFCTSYNEH